MAFNDWASLTKMPYWLAKHASELDKLRQGAVIFWQRFTDMLAWPAKQLDPMTAELELVHLLAWERDIEQITNETEEIYRTRVKFALKFAKGAGSKAGWDFMFEKLGAPEISIEERNELVNWDVVTLRLIDSDLANRAGLIENITRKYGRTTRRYEYSTTASLPLNMAPVAFNYHSHDCTAKIN